MGGSKGAITPIRSAYHAPLAPHPVPAVAVDYRATRQAPSPVASGSNALPELGATDKTSRRIPV